MISILRRKYSRFNEEKYIAEYFEKLRPDNSFVVDLGAGDGVTMSNTYRHFSRQHPGIAVESDVKKFDRLLANYKDFGNVSLIQKKVTPKNIYSLLRDYGVPNDFFLLSLDIDGYDYYVLESILNKFKPVIIVSEINESIPPPLKFKVKYSVDFEWTGGHFFGYSLGCLDELCEKFGYSAIRLEYNNVFLISNDFWSEKAPTLTQLYDQGYKKRLLRPYKFAYNREMTSLWKMEPDEAIQFLTRKFENRQDQFELHR